MKNALVTITILAFCFSLIEGLSAQNLEKQIKVSTTYKGLVRSFNLNFNGSKVKKESGPNFRPYGKDFKGQVRIGTGDINGDGIDDIVTGPGPGSIGPLIKVFDGNDFSQLSTPVGEFFAFNEDFTGGVFVTVGNFDGDNFADIAVATGDQVPQVNVFHGSNGTQSNFFFPYDQFIQEGSYVAAGDIDGDGLDEIITSPLRGSQFGSQVKIFAAVTGTELNSFFAYQPSFSGGIYVSTGDVNGNGSDEIIVGAGRGASPIKIFDGLGGTELGSFKHKAGRKGVRVATGDVTGDDIFDIFVAGVKKKKGKQKKKKKAAQIKVNIFEVLDSEESQGIDTVRVGSFIGGNPGRSTGNYYFDEYESFR